MIAATASLAWTGAHLRADAVQRWQPSAFAGGREGPLWVRAAGAGAPAILLHGLIASGDVFGASFDPIARVGRLVVPDLLGFGRSLDEHRQRFDGEAHLDALDATADRLGLFECPAWVVCGHSLGAAIATQWALRHPDRVAALILVGPPLYATRHDVRTAMRSAGPIIDVLLRDTTLARRWCAWNCRHRTLSGWLTAALAPGLPVPLARQAALHTWEAYRGALDEVVAELDWGIALATLAEQGVRTELVWGTEDRIGDRQLARTLQDRRLATLRLVAGGAHLLPLTHGAWLSNAVQTEVEHRASPSGGHLP